jgi:hypothetical protein
MTEFAYFVERLSQVVEGDGTLLDRCAILATTDCAYGRQHSLEEYPILLAGNACGSLVQGIHYRSTSSENTSKVLLSLVRIMGLSRDKFGLYEGEVSDGLSAIEV